MSGPLSIVPQDLFGVIGILLLVTSPITAYVLWRLTAYASFPKGDWWFIKRFGFRTWLWYEGERHRRERATGVKYDPLTHGEPLLRSIGATEEQIARAKERGLA